MERLTPISRPTAEILLALFKKHSAELNSQIWTFLGELEDDEYREAKLLIAYVMVEHFWRGMTPILKLYPEITPDEMKGINLG